MPMRLVWKECLICRHLGRIVSASKSPPGSLLLGKQEKNLQKKILWWFFCFVLFFPLGDFKEEEESFEDISFYSHSHLSIITCKSDHIFFYKIP